MGLNEGDKVEARYRGGSRHFPVFICAMLILQPLLSFTFFYHEILVLFSPAVPKKKE
jgi:hypothetical protein